MYLSVACDICTLWIVKISALSKICLVSSHFTCWSFILKKIFLSFINMHSMLISSFQLHKWEVKSSCWNVSTSWAPADWESGPKCEIYPNSWKLLYIPRCVWRIKMRRSWGRGRKLNIEFTLLTCCVLFRVVAIMVNARQETINANISGDLVGWL